MTRKRTDLEKALWRYDRSHVELCRMRDAMFPPGCRVRWHIGTGIGSTAVVQQGSMYADQVLTDLGHMGIRFLEMVE